MSKEITAKDLISLVKSFFNVSYDGQFVIRLNDPVPFDRQEFRQLVGNVKLVETNEDDAYIYATYRSPNGARLEVTYHPENGIFWVTEVIVGQGQDA